MMKWWPFKRKTAMAPASTEQEPVGLEDLVPQESSLDLTPAEDAPTEPANHEDASKLSLEALSADQADAPIVVPALEEQAAAVAAPSSPELHDDAEVRFVDSAAENETATPEEAVEALPAPPVGKRAQALQAVRSAFGKMKRSSSAATHKTTSLPLRIIIGYLPEVSERDAREYAQGMAEKHFEQMGISFFQAFKHASGFAFEAHEGGPGKAYLPAIMEYFDAQGPYRLGENHSVTLRTSTRMVEVQRLRDGLAAIVLPEASEAVATEWLQPSKAMVPGLNRRTLFLYAGMGVFATGLLAMLLSATVFRLQTYQESPPLKVESINANNLPRSQWSRIEAVPPNSYVRAIRFRNEKWEAPDIVTETPAAPATPVSPTPEPAKKP